MFLRLFRCSRFRAPALPSYTGTATSSSIRPISSRFLLHIRWRPFSTDSKNGDLSTDTTHPTPLPSRHGLSFMDRIHADRPGIADSVYLVLLVLGCTGTALGVAAYQTNQFAAQVLIRRQLLQEGGIYSANTTTQKAMLDYRKEKSENALTSTFERFNGLPFPLKIVFLVPTKAFMKYCLTYYVLKPIEQRMPWDLCILNTAIWASWMICRARSPLLRSLFRSLAHDPMSKRKWTVSTSTFLHRSLFHLVATNLAIFVFGCPVACWLLARSKYRDATAGPHLLFFYTSSGILSATVSTIAFRAVGYRQLVAKQAFAVSPNGAVQRSFSTAPIAWLFKQTERFFDPRYTDKILKVRPSPVTIGGSGSAYALATVVALTDVWKISDFKTIIPQSAIQWGLGGALLVDVAGVILGWRRFDHWAHLTGAAFGAMYTRYGLRCWDTTREFFWSKAGYERALKAARDKRQEQSPKS